jgi:hypothetical protein
MSPRIESLQIIGLYFFISKKVELCFKIVYFFQVFSLTGYLGTQLVLTLVSSLFTIHRYRYLCTYNAYVYMHINNVGNFRSKYCTGIWKFTPRSHNVTKCSGFITLHQASNHDAHWLETGHLLYEYRYISNGRPCLVFIYAFQFLRPVF